MQTYELTIVLPGGTSKAKTKNNQEKIEKIVEKLKGKVGKVEDWGEKPLGHKIGKNTAGVFLHFILELEPSSVKEFGDILKLDDEFIRKFLVRKN